MKYFILFISAILLCSCSSSPSSDVSVDKFMHDGHSYLFIECHHHYGFEVLHDPNCKCLTSN